MTCSATRLDPEFRTGAEDGRALDAERRRDFVLDVHGRHPAIALDVDDVMTPDADTLGEFRLGHLALASRHEYFQIHNPK